MNLKTWHVYRSVANGDWVYLDRFYWRIKALDCVDSHKIIDENFSNQKIDYKIEYEKQET